MDAPETHSAKAGDLNIAFQVVGDGPLDLVFIPGFASNIELARVRVTRTVIDKVAGSQLRFEGRGHHELKGVPGVWRLAAARA